MGYGSITGGSSGGVTPLDQVGETLHLVPHQGNTIAGSSAGACPAIQYQEDRDWAQWRMPDSPTAYCIQSDGGTTCSRTGEDGDYHTQVSTFVDAGAGLVLDSVTGLIWSTYATGFTQSQGTLDDAVSYCDGLGMDLPTAVELMSLLDVGQPGGRPLTQPIPGETLTDLPYWTTTQQCSFAENTQVVQLGFDTGLLTLITYSTLNATEAYVRCVLPQAAMLSSPTYSAVDAGPLTGGTVVFHDHLTGLDWALPPVGNNPAIDWFSAVSECNHLHNLDCTDWRLASYKELATLMPFGPQAETWGTIPLVLFTSSPVAPADAGPGSGVMTQTIPEVFAFEPPDTPPENEVSATITVQLLLGPGEPICCVRGQ